ncbi:protein disaggregation chaperone [Hyella patelloides LEGE 07179]|uniref:Chaperone protein ClpB n=1 Tax=Hyella patelloides LEGE 07179 TaxID=945734 RepID=A0A563VIJ8_9CYAN|nr:ATP-dependent chaperone ClpB [Hyella patelloides]VEP11244.1 protein disaggregation chaperone [Hyella patelloides LEGE 07179]
MQPTDSSKFTEQAWDGIVKSQEIAKQFQNKDLEVEHVIIALLEEEGLAQTILNKANVDISRLKQQIEGFTNRQPKLGGSQLYLGQALDRMLDRAEVYRSNWDDKYISVGHILVAFAEDGRIGKRTLRGFNVNPQSLEEAIKSIRGSQKVTEQNQEEQYQALEKYGRDLTEEAKAGKLDPVIGRDEEIRRVIQVLSRRSKNNPVLIGEPGVGKTAIAEGLAQRIVNSDVPESLKNRQLISLDMGSLIAGAKYRGEFEDRMRNVLKEITESEGQIVLFIDEVHTIVGAGAREGGGAMDAGNLLKPMLARGELRCIGATTLDEYRKHIEKDPALERRFQQVYVKQPSVEDTVSILRGLKERYEVHHGVKITDSALVAAANLSHRYITDRFLPDKAIDLVDEAAAKLKMEITSKPVELEAIDRRVMQLQMEKLSLEGENQSQRPGIVVLDPASRERLERIKTEIQKLEGKQKELSSQWTSEKELLDEINALKEEDEKLRLQVEQAERAYDLNKAAQLKYGKLEALQRDLEAKEAKLLEVQAQETALLREQVTESDIAEIVANWTGVPVSRLLESEKQKLLQLEGHLHQRIIGQEEAVAVVAAAIRRARAGLKNPGKPIGSFMFMGSTGVGKTELARALAAFLFDSEDAMVRIDMSEYMEKHAVSRLVGAPPGYIGYEEGGQLSEAVRRRPYSVVLLDEVEKAHKDVFNILLQVLDDGRITDSQGRVVDFRNTIIVMTSNVGSEHILNISGDDDTNYEEVKKRVEQALMKHFRPEFINRIDEQIIFHSLKREQLRDIVKIQIKRVEKLLAEQKISIQLSEAAIDRIVEVGYDPAFGARPLNRAIQRELENPIATKILENAFAEGNTIFVDCVDDRLTFSTKQKQVFAAKQPINLEAKKRESISVEKQPIQIEVKAQSPSSDPELVQPMIEEPQIEVTKDDEYDEDDDFIEVKEVTVIPPYSMS